MELAIIALLVVTALALFFDFSNGFHDASNIVATMISSRAISPGKALAMAALAEFVGAYFLGTAVAKMMGKGIVDPELLQTFAAIWIIVATLVGAIAWNLITWYFGIPSSSSHALIGGMIGAFLVAKQTLDIINWWNVLLIFGVLVSSPLIGGLAAALVTRMCYWLFRHAPPAANTFFKRLQIFSSLGLALSHGTNDAQKTMGIITLAMLIIMPFQPLPGWMTDDGALFGGAGAPTSDFAPGQFTGSLSAQELTAALQADFPGRVAAGAEPVAGLNALLADTGFSAAWSARQGTAVTLDTPVRQLLAVATAADTAGAETLATGPGAAGSVLAAMTPVQRTQRLNRLLLEQTYPQQCPHLANNFTVPHWVIITCSLAIAFGISTGGWSIIKTLGGKLYKVKPINGFAAQAGSGLVIYLAAVVGFPVSTTQIVSSSIMGSGAAERPKAVRWGVIGNIMLTWFLTIPGAAVIGGGAYLCLMPFIK